MRILIVDDDPEARSLAARALAQAFPDPKVREAGSEAALRQALAETPPEILITEYALAWSDGLKVYDLAKAAHPDCVFVMVTGAGSEDVAVRALKHGFHDYVVKGPGLAERIAASARTAHDRGHERRAAEETRDLVLREVYHRLQNNLQMAISLMHMSARSIADPVVRSEVADLAQRIQALNALQERFLRSPDYRSVDFGAFLKDLATQVAGLGAGRIALSIDVETVVLTSERAVPLGLIANEVITNAVRHGFPEGRAGSMTVSLKRESEGAVLVIGHDGLRLPEAGASAEGLGHKLVRRLAGQIGAEIALDEASGATRCRITFRP
jgi:two-component sensor histidine kinase